MTTRTVRAAVVAAAVAAVIGAGGVPAGAADGPQRYPAVLVGHGPTLHPEGATWDPVHRRFLVGSMPHGTVSTVRPDGSTATLIDDPALVSVVGLHVDAAHHRVLVVNGDTGAGLRSTPATARRTAGLGAYDLTTGRRLFYTDLAAVAGDGGEHLGNDVAFGPDGTAYVTDSFAPLVYRVGVDGAASVLVRDARLAVSPGGFGLNGIVRQGGVLVIGTYETGALWRVPIACPDTFTRVAVAGGADRLIGLDGLLARPGGTVAGVTNRLGGSGAEAEVELHSPDGWRTARLAAVRPSPDAAPTALTPGPGDRVYQLSGRLDLLFAGTPVDTFTLRRVG
ncbi:SMP-30/gluconolactonase/LRE family protein [Kitasatospora paracochleata]|uniref:Sugar lactone lactonase YvrE n=1 Tax=Kitasatospora paracochleata TaxID=58354 RepID=A0ABT1J558_9ACTN|nr:hypothetical protein [Kitasatospora paracochleata]MCP2312578.1 hypothetical protein [Kitasatospora paracochleata]